MTRFEDTTQGRSAEAEYQRGKQAAQSAKGDARGELYCEVCGLKRYGKRKCKECGAGYDVRVFASNSKSGEFPMSLRDAREFVANYQSND